MLCICLQADLLLIWDTSASWFYLVEGKHFLQQFSTFSRPKESLISSRLFSVDSIWNLLLNNGLIMLSSGTQASHPVPRTPLKCVCCGKTSEGKAGVVVLFTFCFPLFPPV